MTASFMNGITDKDLFYFLCNVLTKTTIKYFIWIRKLLCISKVKSAQSAPWEGCNFESAILVLFLF